ncbi:MAG: apolipoprotein N-acyltransferase [Candidatus Omnitrophota bacterium]
MKTYLRNVAFAFSAGVIGFLAFPPFDISFAGWFCLVPILLTIDPKKPKQNFLYGYLTGVVFFACLLYWLVNVTIPGMIILVLVLAVFYAVFAFFAGFILKYSMNLLILPFIWVVLEFIRGNIFTGFPWGVLGYSQYENTNIIQIADLTGAYGVSFLIVAFNVAIFSVFIRAKKRISYMMLALLFMLASTSYGIYRLHGLTAWGEATVSVVQGNIPQQLKWDSSYANDIVKEYTNLTKRASTDGANLVVWPETSYPYLFEDGKTEIEEISKLSRELAVPILAGGVSRKGDEYFNSAVLFNGTGEIVEKYDKLHLVPFGEYVPFEENVLSILRKYIDKPIGDFGRGKEYTVFPMSSFSSLEKDDGTVIRTTNFFKFGVLICFEDIFPYITREFVKNGANFMVNMTNDAWFGDTAAPRQHMQASVFRAVENRVPVIRAANTGVSCFIDSHGKILSRVELGGKDVFVDGYATDTVNVLYGKSYYTVYGDVFVYFCALMMALLLITEGLLSKDEEKT